MFRRMKEKTISFLKNEDGMGVVEIVLIILVLVGLAFLFRTEINSITNGIFNSIKSQVGKF